MLKTAKGPLNNLLGGSLKQVKALNDVKFSGKFNAKMAK